MIDSEPNQAGDRRTTILFNTTGRDSFPVYLNLLHTLQGRLSTRDPKFTIMVSTQPLPQTVNEDVRRETAISFFVVTAFAFIPTSYVSSLVKEASTKIISSGGMVKEASTKGVLIEYCGGCFTDRGSYDGLIDMFSSQMILAVGVFIGIESSQPNLEVRAKNKSGAGYEKYTQMLKKGVIWIKLRMRDQKRIKN
eukprot:1004702_1